MVKNKYKKIGELKILDFFNICINLNSYIRAKRRQSKNRQAQKRLPIFGAQGRGRTGTGITTHGILSPGRLPVPPLEHI